jgi:hypothetical protein
LCHRAGCPIGFLAGDAVPEVGGHSATNQGEAMMRSRYKTDHPGEDRPLSKWEKLAIATGYDPLGMFNPPLVEAPKRWQSLWERHSDQILSEEIATRPGERPEAWFRWDAPGEPANGESIPEFLGRHGLIGSTELRAMWGKFIERLRHNRVRRPIRSDAGYFVGHFLPYVDADRYALVHPIDGLTSEERRMVDDAVNAAIDAGWPVSIPPDITS